LGKDGIHIDPSKTEVISSWPHPKTVKQVRSYLGMANFYRRFIHRYSQRSAPLRDLLSKILNSNGEKLKKNLFKI